MLPPRRSSAGAALGLCDDKVWWGPRRRCYWLCFSRWKRPFQGWNKFCGLARGQVQAVEPSQCLQCAAATTELLTTWVCREGGRKAVMIPWVMRQGSSPPHEEMTRDVTCDWQNMRSHLLGQLNHSVFLKSKRSWQHLPSSKDISLLD